MVAVDRMSTPKYVAAVLFAASPLIVMSVILVWAFLKSVGAL